MPSLFLGLLAILMLVQLIPLPADIWASLPGRERFAGLPAMAGFETPPRPISLTPELTLNSLLAVLPALVVLVGMASIREDQRISLLPLLIGAACLSAVVGVFQLTSENTSPIYFYEITNRGSPVGFFSNRNHQAAFFALAFPMLRAWTLLPHDDRHYRRRRFWAAAGLGLFLIPMILVTGSRSGMVLGLIGLAAAYFIAPRQRRWATDPKWRLATGLVFGAAAIGLALAFVSFGRAIAIDRLVAADDIQNELRIQHAPAMIQIVRDFFPFGTGFGSFDPVFRIYEPERTLSPYYFNHAHNDLLELAITGGLAGLALLAAFLVWWLARSIPLLRSPRPIPPSVLMARLGSVIILILLVASLVDYPLRTPFLSAILAIACCWLAQFSRPGWRESAQD